MTNRKGNVLVIILAILFLTSTSAAIYFWSQTQQHETNNQSTTPKNNVNNQNPESLLNTGPSDATKSWTKYKNDQYGLTIKYPPTLFLQRAQIDTSSGSYFQQNATGLDDPFGVFSVSFADSKFKTETYNYPTVGIQIYKTKLTAQEWVNKNGSDCPPIGSAKCRQVGPHLYEGVSGIKTIQEDNIPAVQFQSEATSSTTTHTILVANDYLFDVYKTNTGIGEFPNDIYNQMLTTLAFSTPIAPAIKPTEWKVYSNTSQAPDYKPAVKINYPSTWTVSEQSLEGTADLEVSFKDESNVTGIQLQISSRNFLDDYNSQKTYPVTQTTINNRQAYYFSSTNGLYGWLQVYIFPLSHGYVIYRVIDQKFLNMWTNMLPTLNF